MNILLVIEGTYPWYRGGVSEWVYRYIKTCSNIKFSILQVATDTYMDLNPEEALYPLPKNIDKFTRVLPPGLENDLDTSFENWFLKNESSFESALTGNDIIHVANTGFAGWIGVKLKEIYGKPLVLTEHAIYWLEVLKGAVALECGYKVPEERHDKELLANLFKMIASKVYSESDKVVTVSECNIDFQKELGAGQIEYIPNGIPSDWLAGRAKDSDTFTIGWVGRCAEMKNPLQFFDFVDEFNIQSANTSFLMLLSDAGEYELEQKVRDRAKKYPNVLLIWNQPSEEYYQKMDMLLLTSHNESQPLVLFEALAKKVLPIGREVGDFDNKYGLAFEQNSSVYEITKSVLGFWRDKARFKSYVEERVDKVKKNHTWENIFDSYEILLQSLIQEKEYSV